MLWKASKKGVVAAGGHLIFRRGDPVDEMAKLIRETKAGAVFTNRDPDPHGIKVEKRLEKKCKELGVVFESFKDTVLHERAEILTGAGGPYRVFTPYNKNWQGTTKPPVIPAVRTLHSPGGLRSLECPDLKTWKLPSCDANIPEPGEQAARKRLRHALFGVLPGYLDTRNTPLGHTTSRLSVDLRHGTLGIRELYHEVAGLLSETKGEGPRKSLQTYLNELAWREFYMQLLWHFPEVLEHEFDPKFRGLPWKYDEAKLQRWKDGLTGFPIVDAGMRELRATGFMHNRVRMITAMFLTKDLHLDWRAGEEYFMQMLVDGEIASNNGGWQWSAGTGADAAPYFRIQNPWAQTKSYDPEARYIRHWVPELRNTPLKDLLAPPAGGTFRNARDYPPPMVDHTEERDRTLAIFKKHLRR